MKSGSLHIIVVIMATACMITSCNENRPKLDKTTYNEQVEKVSPKLLLLSKGLTTDTLKDEFLLLLDKEPDLHSVAVVVNACSTDKKKFKKTKKVKIQFAEMGFDSTKIELFDVMKTSPKNLREFDIIYILGGNPFLLVDEIHKSGADKVLQDLTHQDKLIMGYSAGALLLGPDLSLMNHVDSLLGFNEIGLTDLTCLGSYDFYIFPHFADFTSQVPELVGKIEEFESSSNIPIYKLNDDQGIIYVNGEVKQIGGQQSLTKP